MLSLFCFCSAHLKLSANSKKVEQDIQKGDTIVFKDIGRFTRERDNG